MTQITNHSEYVSLINTLKAHDYRYFTLNAPTISDEEYDQLYFLAQAYEEQHPEETLSDSPTQCAHGEVKNGHKQILRRTEMLSTEKAQTIEKVQKWMKKTTKKINSLPCGEGQGGVFTVEWKYDGISLSLVYIDGQLAEASYGKGIEGNDCLAHCLKVQSIPNTIPASGRVEVRGEMVVPFANLKKTGYKNCRSAASGIMADTASTLTDCLEFHPYYCEGFTPEDYGCHNPEGIDLQSRFNALMTWGFIDTVIVSVIHNEGEIDDVIDMCEKSRPNLTFPTDGLVVKVADIDKWNILGRNDHHPHYAIAYKFAAATAETTITRIEVTVGKTGKRTPVAYFEPITINGATYQKASIGSEAKLAELGIAEGSRVLVSLRNDVIPHIEKAIASDGETTDLTDSTEEPTSAPSAPSASEENTHVIAEPEIEAHADNADNVDSNSLEEEKSAESVESAGEPETPIRYEAPTIDPITPALDESLCYGSYEDAYVTEPVRHQPKPVVRREPKRKYRMVGEGNNTPSPSNGRGGAIAEERVSVFAYILAALALVAIGILCFASLGAAVFFLPLLAGAFK